MTATRVVRRDFTAPTPTVVMSQKEIQALAPTTVLDIAEQIPAIVPDINPTTTTTTTNNRGDYLDLRGLGANRTLTLVDGERFVPTTSLGYVDTAVIPEAIIDHLDVVTGGASASWGSDAVSGVVNIVLNHNLTGLQGELQGGVSQYGDNESYKASLADGWDFAGGKGHFEIAGEASNNNGIAHQTDRPWSAKDYNYVQTAQYSEDPLPNTRLQIATYGGLILSGPDAGMQFGPGGTLEPFQLGTNLGNGETMTGGDGAAFNPSQALEAPIQRQNVFSRVSYDITPNINAFADVSFGRSFSTLQVVQNFDLVDVIPNTNAFLPPAMAAAYQAAGNQPVVLGRLDNDFGFIRSPDETDVTRVTVGLNGSVGTTWTWNAYYEFGWSHYLTPIENVVNTVNYANSLNSEINPATGAPICVSTLTSPGNGCVPINIFGNGSPSAAALKYVLGKESQVSNYFQNVVSASIQGEPFSDWAGPVSIAAGGEFRRDAASETVDALQEEGVYLVGDAKPFHGADQVYEGFVETVVPLLSNLPLVKSLDVDLAARFTDYSTSGFVTTWKAGVTYAVNDDLHFRATQSQDIRAPSLLELFENQGLNFATVTDPATGASDLITNPQPPNPNLKPEQSDTTTAGVVFQPHWIPGLSVSVDYYNLTVNHVISELAAQGVVTGCFDGDTALCQLITRTNGVITSVSTPFLNLNELHTDGVDFEAVYRLPLSRINESWGGSLTFRLLANYVDDFSATEQGVTIKDGGAVDSVLLPTNIGATGGVPHWRGDLNATYENGPATIMLQERYVGAAHLDNTFGPTVLPNNNVPSVFYTNASVQYRVYGKEGARDVELYGNINNLFNQFPPIVVGQFIDAPATNGYLYDVIGRTFVAGVRFKY